MSKFLARSFSTDNMSTSLSLSLDIVLRLMCVFHYFRIFFNSFTVCIFRSITVLTVICLPTIGLRSRAVGVGQFTSSWNVGLCRQRARTDA